MLSGTEIGYLTFSKMVETGKTKMKAVVNNAIKSIKSKMCYCVSKIYCVSGRRRQTLENREYRIKGNQI